MTTAARVQRLEAYYQQRRYMASDAARKDEAWDAIDKNTADIAQYALVYKDRVELERVMLEPAVPVFLALRHLHGYHGDELLVVPTVPPDEPLPADTREHLQFLEWRAMLPQREAARLGRLVDRRTAVPRRAGVKVGFDDSTEARSAAALQFLLAGDNEGMTWRRSMWNFDGEMWRVKRSVLNACSAALIETDGEDGWGPELEAATRKTTGFDPDSSGPLMCYGDLLTELLRIAAARSTPPARWSEQVKEGQH